MVIESIREFDRAVPFRAYEIRIASGKRCIVPHPDFMLLSPRGDFVIIVDEKGHPYHLNAVLIEHASPVNGHQERKGKKRSR